MREEAELLATLPEGHPMRERLSGVLEARLKGYVRMFDAAAMHPASPLGPFVSTLAGMAMMFFVILGEGDSAIWGLFGPGGVTHGANWWHREDEGWGYLFVFTLGLLLYVIGLSLARRRILPWKWARAMRGERMSPLPTRAAMAQAVSRLWGHVASVALRVWSFFWRRDRQDPANDDPRGSGPDA